VEVKEGTLERNGGLGIEDTMNESKEGIRRKRKTYP
jgi:hypothetical protein